MRRTTLTLPDDLASVLKREARRRDTSVSEVAREALNEHFGLDGKRRRRIGFAAIGDSGAGDVSEHDEEVLAGILEERAARKLNARLRR